MKEKQLTEGRGGPENYPEEGRWCADPQDLYFLRRGACVRRVRDDIVPGPNEAVSIYHRQCSHRCCIDPLFVP